MGWVFVLDGGADDDDDDDDLQSHGHEETDSLVGETEFSEEQCCCWRKEEISISSAFSHSFSLFFSYNTKQKTKCRLS